MFRIRHARRFAARSTVRCAARAAFRVRWRAPDDLGAALTAFGRALRAHRRLARLAPRFFDSVVVERERREREARRRWMALWEPALARAYGHDPSPPKPDNDLPPLPPPRTQRAVELQLAYWNLWFNLGREAIRRHRQRRPHELIDFGRLARLLEIAMDFKRLACGCDPGLPESDPDNHDAALADLERAYGHRHGSTTSAPGSPPAPAAQASNSRPDTAPVQSTVASPAAELPPVKDHSRSPPADTVSYPAAPSPTEQHRCDAWSRWARQMRRFGRTAQ